MNKPQRWALVWAGWTSYLFVAESLALASKTPEAPLCAYLRPILGARKGNAHTALGIAAYAAGTIWFGMHLFGKEGRA